MKKKIYGFKGRGAGKKIWPSRGGVTMNNYTFKCCNEGLCNSSLRGRRPKGREKEVRARSAIVWELPFSFPFGRRPRRLMSLILYSNNVK